MYKVKRAYAFESLGAEAFNANSDVDLLVKFEDGIEPMDYSDNYFNLLFRLRGFLGREVDLVPETSLKNLYFINSVSRTKETIYEVC